MGGILMQQMDCYDLDSYSISISNLMMLKLFHDRGVDVSNFSNPVCSVHYDTSATGEIFIDGMQALFQDTTVYEYGEFPTDFPSLPNEYEVVIVVQDSVFQEVLKGSRAGEIEKIIKLTPKTFEYAEVDILILEDRSGIGIGMQFFGELHDVVMGVLDIKDKAEECVKQTKEREKNGLSSQLFNQRPA
jgi:hypothetical protein